MENNDTRGQSEDSTLVMPTGEPPGPSPGRGGTPAGPPPPGRSTGSAILLGSLVGLGIAAVIAVMLVILVPKDDKADASADDEATATPTETDAAEGTPPPAPVDFGGSWLTNFATLELEQEGMSVSGEYFRFLADNSPRTVKGVITDRILDGTFDGDVNPFRFQLSGDGESFTGHWVDPQGGLHEWCGSRNEPLPDGCGYSGEWRVKGFPPAADLEGDSILMAQYGDVVQMRFDSATHGEVEFELDFDGTTLARATGSAEGIEFEFLVTADADWRTLRGTWRSGGGSGQWCAAQEEAALPC